MLSTVSKDQNANRLKYKFSAWIQHTDNLQTLKFFNGLFDILRQVQRVWKVLRADISMDLYVWNYEQSLQHSTAAVIPGGGNTYQSATTCAA